MRQPRHLYVIVPIVSNYVRYRMITIGLDQFWRDTAVRDTETLRYNLVLAREVEIQVR